MSRGEFQLRMGLTRRSDRIGLKAFERNPIICVIRTRQFAIPITLQPNPAAIWRHVCDSHTSTLYSLFKFKLA